MDVLQNGDVRWYFLVARARAGVLQAARPQGRRGGVAGGFVVVSFVRAATVAASSSSSADASGLLVDMLRVVLLLRPVPMVRDACDQQRCAMIHQLKGLSAAITRELRPVMRTQRDLRSNTKLRAKRVFSSICFGRFLCIYNVPGAMAFDERSVQRPSAKKFGALADALPKTRPCSRAGYACAQGLGTRVQARDVEKSPRSAGCCGERRNVVTWPAAVR